MEPTRTREGSEASKWRLLPVGGGVAQPLSGVLDMASPDQGERGRAGEHAEEDDEHARREVNARVLVVDHASSADEANHERGAVEDHPEDGAHAGTFSG